MNELVSVQKVKEWLDQGRSLRFVDCRFSLSDEHWGENEYKKKHIPQAVYFHLEKDLSGKASRHGGRHPLPDLQQFKRKLEEYGIKKDDWLIAYDQGGAPFSFRFWWLMKYVGHEKVFVLNGGFTEWEKEDFPIESEIPVFEKSSYELIIHPSLLADMEEVQKIALKQKSGKLIDSRERKRYLGEIEPIDQKPGRIPNSIHKYWLEGFSNHLFNLEETQKERFQDLKKDEEIIVYCGSGVTAAPNVFALKSLGYEKVKLYVGSFSDWISYETNPVEVGENK